VQNDTFGLKDQNLRSSEKSPVSSGSATPKDNTNIVLEKDLGNLVAKVLAPDAPLTQGLNPKKQPILFTSIFPTKPKVSSSMPTTRVSSPADSDSENNVTRLSSRTPRLTRTDSTISRLNKFNESVNVAKKAKRQSTELTLVESPKMTTTRTSTELVPTSRDSLESPALQSKSIPIAKTTTSDYSGKVLDSAFEDFIPLYIIAIPYICWSFSLIIHCGIYWYLYPEIMVADLRRHKWLDLL
jgi:hypothetical protein